MADSRHIENRLLVLSPPVIFRLTRYLVYTSRTMLSTRHVTRIATFENSRWRTASILKMVSSLQSGPEKTAQTLMDYNFSTGGHRVMRFPAKCSETGNTKKNSVRLLQLTILC